MKHKTVKIEKVLQITGRGIGLVINEPCSHFSMGDVINNKYEVKYCEGSHLLTSPTREGSNCCLIVKEVD